MSKFERSWLLFKSSLAVMSSNRTLLLFPVLITSLMIFIAALFLLPVAFQPTGYSYSSGQHWDAVMSKFYETKKTDSEAASSPSRPAKRYGRHRADVTAVKPLGLIFFASMYFVSMFCATFLNVAFYSEILKALKGHPVSIGAGLSFACTKWQSILFWTLFAGAVGLIIKSLEERFGWFGQIVLGLIGTAWSIACVFVIPVIITEEESASPVAILKKSALTLTQTWGESLIGYAGISFGSWIVLMSSILWLGGGIALAVFTKILWLIPIVIVAWLIAIVLFSYLMSIASQIFRCALYLYAIEGSMPYPYSNEMTALAWKMKK